MKAAGSALPPEYGRYGIGELCALGYDSVKLDDWIILGKKNVEVVSVEKVK